MPAGLSFDSFRFFRFLFPLSLSAICFVPFILLLFFSIFPLFLPVGWSLDIQSEGLPALRHSRPLSESFISLMHVRSPYTRSSWSRWRAHVFWHSRHVVPHAGHNGREISRFGFGEIEKSCMWLSTLSLTRRDVVDDRQNSKEKKKKKKKENNRRPSKKSKCFSTSRQSWWPDWRSPRCPSRQFNIILWKVTLFTWCSLFCFDPLCPMLRGQTRKRLDLGGKSSRSVRHFFAFYLIVSIH